MAQQGDNQAVLIKPQPGSNALPLDSHDMNYAQGYAPKRGFNDVFNNVGNYCPMKQQKVCGDTRRAPEADFMGGMENPNFQSNEHPSNWVYRENVEFGRPEGVMPMMRVDGNVDPMLHDNSMLKVNSQGDIHVKDNSKPDNGLTTSLEKDADSSTDASVSAELANDRRKLNERYVPNMNPHLHMVDMDNTMHAGNDAASRLNSKDGLKNNAHCQNRVNDLCSSLTNPTLAPSPWDIIKALQLIGSLNDEPTHAQQGHDSLEGAQMYGACMPNKNMPMNVMPQRSPQRPNMHPQHQQHQQHQQHPQHKQNIQHPNIIPPTMQHPSLYAGHALDARNAQMPFHRMPMTRTALPLDRDNMNRGDERMEMLHMPAGSMGAPGMHATHMPNEYTMFGMTPEIPTWFRGLSSYGNSGYPTQNHNPAFAACGGWGGNAPVGNYNRARMVPQNGGSPSERVKKAFIALTENDNTYWRDGRNQPQNAPTPQMNPPNRNVAKQTKRGTRGANGASDGKRGSSSAAKAAKTNPAGEPAAAPVKVGRSNCPISIETDDGKILLFPARKGVYYDKRRKLWRANWKENGRIHTKGFSVHDHESHEEARKRAIEFRLQKERECGAYAASRSQPVVQNEQHIDHNMMKAHYNANNGSEYQQYHNMDNRWDGMNAGNMNPVDVGLEARRTEGNIANQGKSWGVARK